MKIVEDEDTSDIFGELDDFSTTAINPFPLRGSPSFGIRQNKIIKETVLAGLGEERLRKRMGR